METSTTRWHCVTWRQCDARTCCRLVDYTCDLLAVAARVVSPFHCVHSSHSWLCYTLCQAINHSVNQICSTIAWMIDSIYHPADNVRVWLFKQGVALTGRNRTGLPCSVGRPTAHAPGGSVTDDADRHQPAKQRWPIRRAINKEMC